MVGDELYNAASLVTRTIKSDVYASFRFTLLLMQDHMQREGRPY